MGVIIGLSFSKTICSILLVDVETYSEVYASTNNINIILSKPNVGSIT